MQAESTIPTIPLRFSPLQMNSNRGLRAKGAVYFDNATPVSTDSNAFASYILGQITHSLVKDSIGEASSPYLLLLRVRLPDMT